MVTEWRNLFRLESAHDHGGAVLKVMRKAGMSSLNDGDAFVEAARFVARAGENTRKSSLLSVSCARLGQ